MKVGDLVKLKYPRHPHHGRAGVIVENDKTFLSLPNSPNYFRVIWTVSQNDTWLKQQQIEVINERTNN